MKKNSGLKRRGFIPAPIGDNKVFSSFSPFYNFLKRNPRLVRGFTLVELLVALGIFSLAILLGVGGFARALRTERQVSAFASVNSNMSLALEQIAREIRTGVNFCANGTESACGSPSVLSFINAKGETVTYCFDGTAIERFTGAGFCGSGQKLTADNVSVQYMRFIIFGNKSPDTLPSQITILAGASPKDASAASYTIHLETTVSSRIGRLQSR